MALDPNDPESFFDLGVAYHGLGKLDQAIAAFRRVIELNPAYARAQYNLGTLLLRAMDYEAALQPLGEAIRLDPQSSDAFYNLAATYASLEEKENALQHLARAIVLKPALASTAQRDPDFQSLHADPEFVALTQQRRSKEP